MTIGKFEAAVAMAVITISGVVIHMEGNLPSAAAYAVGVIITAQWFLILGRGK